ncbi:MAG TPA: Asd/ArgC dimerization domain-containing protein [Gemmatimonadales bacterium]|nr:Asd/ArgC dimerization domain-containing protein [Gemmatimonadales bacterium]
MVSRATLALVGGESLLGREIRDIVATSESGFNLRLIAAEDEETGRLTRVGDEPSMVSGLAAGNLSGAQAILLAGSPESSRKVLELAGDSSAVIDLTYAAEDHPNARLRAPSVETEPEEDERNVHVIAHPAAIAVAVFLRRLQAHDPLRRSIVQILAPASAQGKAGLEELQQQAVNLLSFKPLPKAVYDAQVGFNLLARFGDEAPASLEESELRIERHLATLLSLPGDGEGAPLPSLRVIQAPVFHGYTFSAWVEFESNPGVEALESGLATEGIDVHGEDLEPPNIVGQAGQGGIAVGGIAADRNNADACWFWVVTDNLRLMAENAVAVANQIL